MAEQEQAKTAVEEKIVAIRCPACGHQTLFIGSGGWITCSWIGCPNPSIGEALEQARLDIIRASQLQHEVDEARREALAMRRERDDQIARSAIVLQAARDIVRLPKHVDLIDFIAELHR